MTTSTNDDKGVTATVSDAAGLFSSVEITAGALTLDDTTNGLIYERGRSDALGALVTPAFSAESFFSDVGAWTVAAGDVATFAYSLVGMDMHLSFWINTSSVSGTPAALYILIPAGHSASASVLAPMVYSDNGAAAAIGYAEVLATNTVVQLLRPAGATWGTAVNTTSVVGQIHIPLRGSLLSPPSSPSAPRYP